ncbi:MAG: glycosyltransferase family 9 protein [Filimonas sp.]|nr:glycosyltransferase family 9 protein [Filimonas sp.]
MQILAKQWTATRLPKRILVIRLQAMGDVIITLPYLQALRNMLPASVEIDFLTRAESASVPCELAMFRKVYVIHGGRSFKKQIAFAAMLLPQLLLNRYDIVIDLQNNELTRKVRQLIAPKAWSGFDRFSCNPAGERNRATIEAIGLGNITARHILQFKTTPVVDQLLSSNGWDGKSALVILNPAGAFVTRNWPLEYYISFARLWLEQRPETQFVITGIALIAEKAKLLKQALGDKLINLVMQTSPVEAMAIVQKATLVLSEDSGLMHMAWVSGIPTVVLFGSTRSDWSRPLGEHTVLLDSSDLACGNCMREHCLYRDTPCLKRYSPEIVADAAVKLIQKVG